MMTSDIEKGEELKAQYAQFAEREERKENSLLATFIEGTLVGGAIIYLLMPKAH